MYQIERLADQSDYRITYYKKTSFLDVLVISFGYVGTGLADEGFGSKFLMTQGYDHIYVAQKKGSNYQGLSLKVFGEIVGKIAKQYSKVFTYGHSLGGYCSLYYAGEVDAQAIAFVPRNPSHPSVNKKNKYPIFRHNEIQEVRLSSCSPIVIYDPLNKVDERYVREYVKVAYRGLREVKIDHLGHKGAPKNFIRSGVLKEFITKIIEEDHIVDIKINFDRHPEYNYIRAKQSYQEGDLVSASTFLKMSIEEEPLPESLALLKLLNSKISSPVFIGSQLSSEFIKKLLAKQCRQSPILSPDVFYEMGEFFATLCEYDLASKMMSYALMLQPGREKFKKRYGLYSRLADSRL